MNELLIFCNLQPDIRTWLANTPQCVMVISLRALCVLCFVCHGHHLRRRFVDEGAELPLHTHINTTTSSQYHDQWCTTVYHYTSIYLSI